MIFLYKEPRTHIISIFDNFHPTYETEVSSKLAFSNFIT